MYKKVLKDVYPTLLGLKGIVEYKKFKIWSMYSFPGRFRPIPKVSVAWSLRPSQTGHNYNYKIETAPQRQDIVSRNVSFETIGNRYG